MEARYQLLEDLEKDQNEQIQKPPTSKQPTALTIILGFTILLLLGLQFSNWKSSSTGVTLHVQEAQYVTIKPKVFIKNWTRFADFYFTQEESQFLNCSTLWKGNTDAIDKYVNNGRMKLEPRRLFDLPMSCEAVRFRLRGDARKFEPLERRIAFVRNVFKLYELQEAFLSTIYHPDNTFCYALDSKSDERLKTSIRNLATCFDNIVVLDKEFNFDSSGHRQDRAHFACLQEILNRKWDHAIILQSSDMIIKSPYQLSDLSRVLNYTSTMGMEFGFTYRYNTSADWTPAGLKLFKNETGVPANILHRRLKVRKGLNEVIVSKIFVRSMFDKLNLDRIIDLFDNNSLYGVDEMLINTLYENYLGLDGQMESECTKKHEDPLTRLTHWNYGGADGYSKGCKSKWKRHGICILGVEYLKELKENRLIIANKVVSDFDFGTVLCIREMVRKHETARIPDEKFLQKFPQFVEMQLKTSGKFNATTFKC